MVIHAPAAARLSYGALAAQAAGFRCPTCKRSSSRIRKTSRSSAIGPGVRQPEIVTGQPLFGIDVTCRACSMRCSRNARSSAARWPAPILDASRRCRASTTLSSSSGGNDPHGLLPMASPSSATTGGRRTRRRDKLEDHMGRRSDRRRRAARALRRCAPSSPSDAPRQSCAATATSTPRLRRRACRRGGLFLSVPAAYQRSSRRTAPRTSRTARWRSGRRPRTPEPGAKLVAATLGMRPR